MLSDRLPNNLREIMPPATFLILAANTRGYPTQLSKFARKFQFPLDNPI